MEENEVQRVIIMYEITFIKMNKMLKSSENSENFILLTKVHIH